VPFTTNNGVRISWQEQGTGTPLLLIMGHAFPSDMWWPVLPAFTANHRGFLEQVETASLAS
jgi:pimeloyl-ACP methyl ester carboxylesterase